jgi:hypothetical protein
MAQAISTHFRNFLIPHRGNDFRPVALRHHNLALYGVLAALAKVIVAVIISAVPLARVLPSAITPTKLVELTNDARVSAGLKPLTVNRILATAAGLKARDMLAGGYFAHISPAKVTPWAWFKRAGYNYAYAGENLAIDFTTAEGLVDAWLGSPSHRRNILSANFKEIGIAVETGSFKGSPTTMAVQFFGTPVAKPKVVKTAPAKPTVPAKPAPVAVNPPPKKQVLGETEVVVPPPAPVFLSPESDSTVAGPQPWVSGEALPGALVTVQAGTTALGSATASSLGYFRFQLTEFPDGPQTVTAYATDPATGKVSAASAAVTFTVDSAPPTVNAEQSYVVPTPDFGRYDMVVAVSADAEEVTAVLGDRRTALTKRNDQAVGQIDARGATATVVQVTVRDGAGNASTTDLVDLTAFAPNLLVAAEGPDFATRIKLLLLSRSVVLSLLLFLTVALALHILVEVRIQHHPTTVSTLLLIGFLVVLFLV